MPTGAPPKGAKSLWVALGLVLALVVGTVAGVLDWLSGQAVAAAILTGGVTFGGAVALALSIFRTMRD